MVFWLGILCGAFIAWCAVESGFYRSFVLLFNGSMAVYVAVFSAARVVAAIPECRQTPYGYALTLIVLVGAGIALLQGAAYLLLPDTSDVHFPRLLESLGAGVLGFAGGLLLWGFLALAVWLSPLGQMRPVQQAGLDQGSRPTNIAYLCTWCDAIHRVAGSDQSANTAGTIDEMRLALLEER